MNELPEPRESAAAKAEGELARLNGQVEAMRSVLIQLLQDVVRAESQLDNSQANQLLEANERLVVAALGAQTDAATAAIALDDATHSGGLDPLTGLPNRTLLLDRLAKAISNAKRHGHRLALLFLDLNNFKLINDTFGHASGDRALQLVADCLTSQVRETDTVSRHGGDEFLILLAEVTQAADAALIAEKVNAALGAYSQIDGHLIRLTASIGISVYPEDGEDAKTLIDRADAAMYLAKQHPLGGFAFYADQSSGQPDPEALQAQSPPQRLTRYELAMAEHERRHAQLREANEKLVLAALGAQELQAAAEQALQRQGELLTVVARELRNPLAPIRTAAAMLGRPDADELLLPRAQALIEQQAVQLSRLASGLLDPTQVGKGRLTLEPGVFDLAAVIDDVVRACRPEMDRRLQVLELDVPAGPLEVRGDPALVAQALTNLFNNATTYTHNGGRIRLSVGVTNNALVMTISDNGAGIRPEALATIFDPFVRDPRATAVHQEGLGIGLTVAREIIEAHGGSVFATSPGPGQGSQFVVSLPIAPIPTTAGS